MSKAFIDQGKIVIISDNGMNYEKEITEKEKDYKSIYALSIISLVISAVLMLNGLSKFFTDFYSGWQVALFIVSSIIVFMYYSDLCTAAVNEKYENKKLINEYNIAKSSQQNNILELEKVITNHQKVIEEINCKQELDFAQNFKKERTIPKSMLSVNS